MLAGAAVAVVWPRAAPAARVATGSASSVLGAVSCSGARACTAVVSSVRFSSSKQVLGTVISAERWNGRRWVLQPMPNPAFASLTAVSCAAPAACTAVGLRASGGAGTPAMTLAERWNGRRWAVQRLPRQAGASYLNGVSCSSATACTAVGDDVPPVGATVPHVLALRWDGARWRIEPTPTVSGRAPLLLGVWCSAADACTAVGAHGPPLAERCDGARWSVQTTLNPR